jgi:hypothetical protein
VRGLVIADRYYLVYSGSSGGTVGLTFDGSFDGTVHEASVNAEFAVQWASSVGYSVDFPDGGPLAYRVSSVRCRRHRRPESIQKRILDGASESEALDALTSDERRELVADDALDMSEATFELMEDLDTVSPV